MRLRLTIEISEQELEALQRLAEREVRSIKEQARYILGRELSQAKDLTLEHQPIPIKPQSKQPHRELAPV